MNTLSAESAKREAGAFRAVDRLFQLRTALYRALTPTKTPELIANKLVKAWASSCFLFSERQGLQFEQ